MQRNTKVEAIYMGKARELLALMRESGWESAEAFGLILVAMENTYPDIHAEMEHGAMVVSGNTVTH